MSRLTSLSAPNGWLKAISRRHNTNRARSSAPGVARFLLLGVGYLLAFLGTAAAPWLGLQLIGSIALFLFTFNLAMVGHDAAHGSLTRSARLNGWIGRLAVLASYVPYSGWSASHNAMHHPFTNLRGKDPQWVPLTKLEYDALSPLGRAWHRWQRTLFGVAIGNIRLGLKLLLFPGQAVLEHIPRRAWFTLERWAVLGFLLVQVAGLLAWQGCLEQTWGMPARPISGLATAILLPALLMNWQTGLLAFLHHTRPRVRWYADPAEWPRQPNLECCVHLIAPWPLDWLLGNSLEHAAHHVAPRAPDGELAAVLAELEAAFPDAVCRVKLTDCPHILAFCKLYDYEKHCWLGYDGKPMGEYQSEKRTQHP
jgi:omega-6 fatty acid desaturase (delta-12 desaturase)